MPTREDLCPVLYNNGLGNGETRLHEKIAFRRLETQGFAPEHNHVDHRNEPSLGAVIDRQTDRARSLLRVAPKIKLVGESAGGPLQLGVFKDLMDFGVDPERVQVVTIASWLQGGGRTDAKWSHRTLEQAAHLDGRHPSQLFYDAVQHSQNNVLPNLRLDELCSITRLVPLAGDRIVPRAAMATPQAQVPIESYVIPAVGHSAACAVGLISVGQYLE